MVLGIFFVFAFALNCVANMGWDFVIVDICTYRLKIYFYATYLKEHCQISGTFLHLDINLHRPKINLPLWDTP